jgi:hypothetical protein
MEKDRIGTELGCLGSSSSKLMLINCNLFDRLDVAVCLGHAVTWSSLVRGVICIRDDYWFYLLIAKGTFSSVQGFGKGLLQIPYS